MQWRRGVSLVEVMVALVLLGLGVSGTLASVAAAGRLRDAARSREAMAALAADRLDWFVARACAGLDSMGADTAGRAVSVWRVVDSASVRGLRVELRDALGRVPGLQLRSGYPCG